MRLTPFAKTVLGTDGMKILVTLRHPGPVAAIMEIVRELQNKGIEVILILSDSALQIVQKMYLKYVDGIAFYYFDNDWTKDTLSNVERIQVGCTEFESMDSKEFMSFKEKLAEIINMEKPDIILRTTTALKYGVDEAITSAANEMGLGKKIRCYQEIYDCGMDLEQIEGPIAVVDEIAKERLSKRNVKSVPIGWMNQVSFSQYGDFESVRELIRQEMQISSDEFVVLYCCTASGNDKAEENHFENVVKHLGNKKIYVKFHPRNSEQYRKRIMHISQKYGVEEAGDLKMEEALSFADVIISPGSVINLDCLQYQIVSGIKEIKTYSVFVNDDNVKRIMNDVFGTESQPYMETNMGSVSLDSFDELESLEEIIRKQKSQLYSEAMKMFGTDLKKTKENFIKYIKEDK